MKGTSKLTVTNGKPIKITIKTLQQQDGQLNKYQQEFSGRLAKVKENTYLRYEEDQNLTVTFKVDEKGIWLTRKGSQMKLRLYFDEAKHYETNYQTPFGAINLTCQTQKVLFEEENAKGQLAVDYQLFSGEELLGEYKIRLQFEA